MVTDDDEEDEENALNKGDEVPKKKFKMEVSMKQEASMKQEERDFEFELKADIDRFLDSIEADYVCKNSSGKVISTKCPLCQRIFANRYNLKVHIRDKHDSAKKTIQCNLCQKRMRNQSCLRVHLYHHRKQSMLQNSLQSDSEANIPTENSVNI
jgi:hypothetical protein